MRCPTIGARRVPRLSAPRPAKGAERLERAGEKETDCGTLREFFHVLEAQPRG